MVSARGEVMEPFPHPMRCPAPVVVVLSDDGPTWLEALTPHPVSVLLVVLCLVVLILPLWATYP